MSGDISFESKIEEITKKYNLSEKRLVVLDQIKKETDPKKIKELTDKLPVNIISKIMSGLKIETITPENIESEIKILFSFSDDLTKAAAKDFLEAFEIDKKERLEAKKEYEEETLFQKKVQEEKEKMEKEKKEEVQTPKEKNIISDIPSLQKPITPPAPKKEAPIIDQNSLNKDPYRELPSEEELKSKFYSI